MASTLASDYALVCATAETLAGIADTFAAVYIGGVGADWSTALEYPYAVVGPEDSERSRGEVSRSVRVRIVSRASSGALVPVADSEAESSTPIYVVGGADELCALVGAVSDALASAHLGAPLESIAATYDEDAQGAPTTSATLSISFSDAQAFGDSF